ncbi:hypothetical protein [Pseudomonas sp. RL_15y_Pfl2_60]|uniref:hypothetical protein n=1 Tax=Pseudomonas sp. RL_15y_Pfl2_60 TaxID=3088709 RepID=UPI0030DC496F
MKNSVPNPQLNAARISATVSKGFSATTTEGRPGYLAIVDQDGKVIESGSSVAWAAWRVCIEVQENFWEGQGHLVVHSGPPVAPAASTNKSKAA